MFPWASLFWLIIILFIMFHINQWIKLHVQGVGFLITDSEKTSIWIYFFIFSPGIFIHELSHSVMAILLGVKTSNFTLWPTVKKQGGLVLGSVVVHDIDPVRHTLIGFAPLLFGSIIILFIGRFLQLDVLGQAIRSGDLENLFSALWQTFTAPDFWLWLYLLFAIAHVMMPSYSDRIYWGTVLGLVIIIMAITLALNRVLIIPEFMQVVVAKVVTIITSALSMALVVDLFFMSFIGVLEAFFKWTTQRRVRY